MHVHILAEYALSRLNSRNSDKQAGDTIGELPFYSFSAEACKRTHHLVAELRATDVTACDKTLLNHYLSLIEFIP